MGKAMSADLIIGVVIGFFTARSFGSVVDRLLEPTSPPAPKVEPQDTKRLPQTHSGSRARKTQKPESEKTLRAWL